MNASTFIRITALSSLSLLGTAAFGQTPADGQKAKKAPALQQMGSKVADSVKEPETGLGFPLTLALPRAEAQAADAAAGKADKGRSLALGGLGARKRGDDVDVYAVGYYLDAQAAAEPLAKLEGQDAKALKGNAAFYEALNGDELDRAIRIVFAKNVTGQGFSNNFLNEITQRMGGKASAGESAGRPGKEDLDKLRTVLAKKDFKEGLALTFFSLSDGTLVVTVGEEEQGRIRSLALCRTVPELYLGKDAIQSSLKPDLAKRLPKTLQQQGGRKAAGMNAKGQKLQRVDGRDMKKKAKESDS